MPPMWTRAFASARFAEKSEQVSYKFSRSIFHKIEFFLKSYDVRAIDGDTGINTDICYRLEFNLELDAEKNCETIINETWIEFDFYFILLDSALISIEETAGKIDVKAIDRDAMKIEFFPFEVSYSMPLSAYIQSEINFLSSDFPLRFLHSNATTSRRSSRGQLCLL